MNPRVLWRVRSSDRRWDDRDGEGFLSCVPFSLFTHCRVQREKRNREEHRIHYRECVHEKQLPLHGARPAPRSSDTVITAAA